MEKKETSQMMAVSDGLLKFTASFYQELDSSSNIVFSPFSLLTALAMAYVGSKNNTAKQFERIFGLADDSVVNHATIKAVMTLLDASKEGEEQILYFANRLLQSNFQVKQEFLDLIKNLFNSSLSSINFRDCAGSCRDVNSWISSQTKGKINKLLSESDIADKTKLLLVSAIYFKGKWKEPFKDSLTHAAPFFLSDGSQRLVDTMHIKSRLGLSHFPQFACRLLEIPYSVDRLHFFVLLPDSVNGLSALESLLTPSNLSLLFTNELPVVKVHVTLPRFQVEASLSAMQLLQKLGLTDLFSEQKCDLSDISEMEELFVSAVAHSATIEVTEEGTEAAAATSVVGRQKRSLPVDEEEFEANHPFIFFIRDQVTGIILFFGRLTEPQMTKVKEEL